MGIQYGSLNVDEKYKSTVLPNLFYRTWMVPGVTYQDVSEDNAGGCYWHKLTSTGAAVPGVPGRDFDDEAAADTLVQAAFNNNFQKSKKIYNVQAAAVAFPVAENHLALATNEVSEGKNQSALGCLIQEGTAATGTTAITKTSFDKDVLDVRKEIVDAKGVPDTVLCSTNLFETMLEHAGDKYTPTTNEMLLAAARGGQVGNYLGMTWIECNGLSASGDIKYYDYSGALKTVANATIKKVDFIMYDHMALGIGDNFNMLRLIDSERFSGSLAQVEDNVAMRVLNAAAVKVRSHT